MAVTVLIVIVIIGLIVLRLWWSGQQQKKATQEGYDAGFSDGKDEMPMPSNDQIIRGGRWSNGKYADFFLTGYQSGYRDGHRQRQR